MNTIRKAVIAGLTAGVAYVQATSPNTASDWLKCGAAALVAGSLTWYVPNTQKGTTP